MGLRVCVGVRVCPTPQPAITIAEFFALYECCITCELNVRISISYAAGARRHHLLLLPNARSFPNKEMSPSPLLMWLQHHCHFRQNADKLAFLGRHCLSWW
jgi:hypothetical protein